MITQNPFGYVEIPAVDLDRATKFYAAVFGYEFERTVVDGYEMALFPYVEGRAGASGALAKGETYKPSKDGAVIYFSVENIDETLARAKAVGANLVYPNTFVDGNGYVAEIEDSEGNRIALHHGLD